MKYLLFILLLIALLSFMTVLLNVVCERYVSEKNKNYNIEITDANFAVYHEEKKSNNEILSFKSDFCKIRYDFMSVEAKNVTGWISSDKKYNFKSDNFNLTDYKKKIDFKNLYIYPDENKKIYFANGELDLSDNTLISNDKIMFNSDEYSGYAKSCYADLKKEIIFLKYTKLEFYNVGF